MEVPAKIGTVGLFSKRGPLHGAGTSIKRVGQLGIINFAKPICQETIEVNLLLGHETLGRKLTGHVQIDDCRKPRRGGYLDGTPAIVFDLVVIDFASIADLNELIFPPSGDGAKGDHDILKSDRQ